MAADPPPTDRWHTHPLFVSSTFKDLHAERDHLRRFIFPELENRLKQRHRHLETIDLRLGVETVIAREDENELCVLKVCLDEIERSRPYFIAILGDRYGWVPPEDRIAAAAAEAGFSINPAGKSVTALEIEYAMLAAHSEERPRCWFYFRDPLPYDRMPRHVAGEYSDAYSDCESIRAGHDRLQALKTRLENDPLLCTRVRRYRATWNGSRVVDLNAWGQQVLEDLWTDLDAEPQELVAAPERVRLADVTREMPPEAFGSAEAKAFAAVVAVSRFGWRTGDLRKLVPVIARLYEPGRSFHELDDLAFAVLRHEFRAHLSRHSSMQQWDFDTETRRAVAARSLSDAGLVQRIHSAIADHLLSLPPGDPSPRSELMVHLIAANDRKGAARIYADARLEERGSFTKALSRHLLGGGPPALEWVISLLSPQLPPEERNFRPHALYGAWRSTVIASHFQFALNEVLDGKAPLSTRMALLRAAQSVVTRLAEIDPSNLNFQRTLVIGFEKIGDVLRAEGNVVGALEAYREATDILKHLAVREPDEREWQFGLARNHKNLARTLEGQGAIESSIAAYRQAVATYERLLSPDRDNDASVLDVLASLHGRLGAIHSRRKDTTRALLHFRAAVDARKRVLEIDPDDVTAMNRLSLAYEKLGDELANEGDLSGAQTVHRAGLALDERMTVLEPDSPTWQSNLAIGHEKIGEALAKTGELAAAVAEYRAAIAARKRLAALRPEDAGTWKTLAERQRSLGDFLREHHEPTEALVEYRAAMAVLEEHLECEDERANCWNEIGLALKNLRDFAAALEAFRAAIALGGRLVAGTPCDPALQRDLAVYLGNAGGALMAVNDAAAALVEYRASLAIRERLSAADPENRNRLLHLVVVQNDVGRALEALGDHSGALATFRAVIGVQKRRLALEPNNEDVMSDLAVFHQNAALQLEKLGNHDAAVDDYRATAKLRARLRGASPRSSSDHSIADVFISYAREDRDIVRPLVEALEARGITVWFDDRVLSTGEHVEEPINAGVRNARYGVVILSPRYLVKDWPRQELIALWMREPQLNRRVVLPVVHDMTNQELEAIDPVFKSRSFARTDQGLDDVAERITNIISRERGRVIEALAPIAPDEVPRSPWQSFFSLLRELPNMPLNALGVSPHVKWVFRQFRIAMVYVAGILSVMFSQMLSFLWNIDSALDQALWQLEHVSAASYGSLLAAMAGLAYLWVKLVWRVRGWKFTTAACLSALSSLLLLVLWVPFTIIVIRRELPERSLMVDTLASAGITFGLLVLLLVVGIAITKSVRRSWARVQKG